MLGALKVMIKVLVFLLLPESSLTVMFVMSELGVSALSEYPVCHSQQVDHTG